MVKKGDYIFSWIYALLFGSTVWGVILGLGWGLLILGIATVVSLPYILFLVLLEHIQMLNAYATFYVVNTLAFVLVTVLLYLTPSAIDYFNYFVVPYYLFGMIHLMIYQWMEKK